MLLIWFFLKEETLQNRAKQIGELDIYISFAHFTSYICSCDLSTTDTKTNPPRNVLGLGLHSWSPLSTPQLWGGKLHGGRSTSAAKIPSTKLARLLFCVAKEARHYRDASLLKLLGKDVDRMAKSEDYSLPWHLIIEPFVVCSMPRCQGRDWSPWCESGWCGGAGLSC